MKRVFCLIFLLVFLVACTPSSSSSAGEISSEINMTSSTSFLETGISVFPKVEAPLAANLGFDPNERMAVPIELEYEITNPSEDFLNALEKLDDVSYRQLQDEKNYFCIGDYQLFFYDLAGLFGPSKICVIEPNGIVQQIFYSTQPIRQIHFVLGQREMYVELLSVVYPEGYTGDTYKLDLLNEKLWPTDYEEIHLADSNGYVLYGGQQYCWSSDFETGLRTLFKGADILEGEKIVGDIKTDPVFANGSVYYFKPNDSSLYYHDLQEDKFIHEENIKSDIVDFGWRFCIYENVAVYEDNQFEVTMVDIETGQIITTLPLSSIDSLINFAQDGLYFHSIENELVFCDYSGNMETLFTDVTEVFVEAVLNDWVYFSIRQLNSNGATPYGRVKLDGTELIYFS
jgi:hypothetical protein